VNPLQSLPEYEQFVYTLPQHYASIRSSALTVIRRGATIALLTGTIELVGGFRLVAREKLSFAEGPGVIVGYGYEVWQGEHLLYWYDSQPHPHDPVLSETYPHHKHIPPEIKHHRIPAPGLNSNQANLPFLISEIEKLQA
jgi:hypothetical protein